MICRLLGYTIMLIPIIISVIFLKKKKIKLRGFKFLIYFILLVIIMYYLSLIPLEYIFMRFDTIEEAFKYSYPNMEIIDLYNNNEYAVVNYVGGNTYHTIGGTTVFVKKNNKWSGANNLLIKIKIKTVDNKILYIYNIDKFNSAYVDIEYFNENDIISDNKDGYHCNMVDTNSKYYSNYKNHCSILIENINDNSYIELGNNKIYLK